jgi:hypothetical protein
MKMVNSLPIQAGGRIQLKYIVFPVEQFLKGIVSEVEVEGVFKLVLYFFAESA